MNGSVLEANKDFYYKNVSGLGIIAIEKDSKGPYGAAGYIKDNADDTITIFDKFVTRGANGSVDNGTRKEIAIKEGLYQYDFSEKFHKNSGYPKAYPYIKNLDGSDKIPTETPNQIQGRQSFADLIFVHPMDSNAKSITAEGEEGTGSAGCIGPGSNQKIFRTIYEKTENKQGGMIILIRPDN